MLTVLEGGYRQRGYSSSPAFDFQADRFSDRGAVAAAFRSGERQLNPGVLEYKIGAANSSSQKPVGRPVFPGWSSDVRTISIFISFSFVSVSGSSPPVTDRWKHVAYHSQGVETKDNGDHRTLLFADLCSGSTRPTSNSQNINRTDALLFGRVTYEMLEAYWQPLAPELTGPFAPAKRGINKS